MARILVIEDNPDNLQLMAYLLTAFGHQAIETTDGEAGIAEIRRQQPDLILCDLHLPGMDGYEIARYLKGDPALRPIPLVAVTALAMVGDREKVLAAGFDGYLPKPIAPESFVGQVDAFLRAEQRTAPPAMHPDSLPLPAVAASPRATILAVDNSPPNLELIRTLLEPAGYAVLAARTASEAMDLLQQHQPDLILSDLHMPGRDGYMLIHAIKADPHLRSIPFLFLSSTIWNAEDQRKGLDLGAARFLLRPIEPQKLLQEIEACLKGE